MAISGTGTESDPWLIHDATDLVAFAGDSTYWVSGTYAKLMGDCDMTGITDMPRIGTSSSAAYHGKFNGNGHYIMNVGTSSSRVRVQLFYGDGETGTSEITNLGFKNWYVRNRAIDTGIIDTITTVDSIKLDSIDILGDDSVYIAYFFRSVTTCSNVEVRACTFNSKGYSGVCWGNWSNAVVWDSAFAISESYSWDHIGPHIAGGSCFNTATNVAMSYPSSALHGLCSSITGTTVYNNYAVNGGTSLTSNDGLAITQSIYEQKNFWNNVGVVVGGITYKCGWDFVNTWYWDATDKRPKLRAFVVQISTITELQDFAQRVNAGETSLDGLLTADIDATGVTWNSIGVYAQPYEGILDGDGHTISNLNDIFMYCGNSRISRIKFSDCNLDFTSLSNTSSFLFYANPTTECTFEELWIDGCTFKYYVPSGCYGPSGTVFIVQGTTVNISNVMVTDITIDSSGYNNGCGAGGVVSLVSGMVTTLNMENCYANGLSVGTPHGKTDTNISSIFFGQSFAMESAAHTHNISECIFRGNSTQGYVYSTYSSVVSNLTKIYFDATTTRGHVTSTHTNYNVDGTEVAHDLTSQQEFYDGTGIAGTVYLEWDFTNTWEWDSETESPILKIFAQNAPTVKVWNGSDWVDGTPHVWDGTAWKQADKVWVNNGTEWKEGV